MKRAALVVLAAIAALVAATGSGSATRPSVLAILNGRLGRYDAVTLKPLGHSIAVGKSAFVDARSPSGAQLAVGSNHPALVRIVDVRSLRTVRTIPLDGDEIDALNWVAPRALLVELGGITLYRIDPLRARATYLKLLPTSFTDFEPVPTGFVYLSTSTDNTIGPATLSAIDASGVVRSALLDRISVGFHETDANVPDVEEQVPGLAVDPDRAHAYVVAPDRTVADVDLRTMAVTYQDGSRVLAKSWQGSERQAEWLGNGLIAVAGRDSATDTPVPTGLELLDTTSWAWRPVDPRVGWLGTGTNALVGYEMASDRTTAAQVYDRAGNARFRVTGSISAVWIGGRSAYAWDLSGRKAVLQVLDPATGRLLKRFSSAWDFVPISG